MSGCSVADLSHAMRIASAIANICSLVMGSIAVPASQQHMTAGFMLATIEDVVLASKVKFFFVAFSVPCLDLFQSILMKIMCTSAVLCSIGPVPCSVAAAQFLEADHADTIASLVE